MSDLIDISSWHTIYISEIRERWEREQLLLTCNIKSTWPDLNHQKLPRLDM